MTKFCVLFSNYLYLHFENPSAMKQSTLMRFCRLWSFSITSESLSCKACFGSFFHLIRKQVTKTINITTMLFLWEKFILIKLNHFLDNIVISTYKRETEKKTNKMLFLQWHFLHWIFLSRVKDARRMLGGHTRNIFNNVTNLYTWYVRYVHSSDYCESLVL